MQEFRADRQGQGGNQAQTLLPPFGEGRGPFRKLGGTDPLRAESQAADRCDSGAQRIRVGVDGQNSLVEQKSQTTQALKSAEGLTNL